MDTSARFFSKLRNMAVSLETETASLHHKHQHFEEDDDVNTEGAARVLHELHSEVRNLKGQVQGQLANQQVREAELRSFLKACVVLRQRTSEDIQTLQGHFEKYGYRAPKNTPTCSAATGGVAPAEGEEEDDAAMEAGEEDQEAEEEAQGPLTPESLPTAPAVDPMRTPQLSDFGLSEIHLERILQGGTGGATAPTPVLPLHTLSPTPKTPKCTLRLDDDDLLSPRMEDFGISEHTMCLNNDFTMDLHRKKLAETARSSSVCSGLGVRAPHTLSTLPSNCGMPSLAAQESMESPEPPVLCTPGFKMARGRPPLPQLGHSDPGSPRSPEVPAAESSRSPEVPAFESLCITRLLNARKGEGESDDVTAGLAGEAQQAPALSRPWAYDHSHTPEEPSLDSFSSPSRSVRQNGAEPDGPAQELTLGSPRVRRRYAEPSTPETPDLSSVTQDICKLVSRVKTPSIAVLQPTRRVQAVALVTETEFQCLPSFLRQVPLTSLNQAVQRINSAVQDQAWGADAAFLPTLEELKQITGVDAQAPMFFMCLTELRRLEQVHGVGSNAVYRVPLHT